MIIDAHAHACGVYLKGENIIEILNMNLVDKVVLVPGDFGSDKNYLFPELGDRFPNTDLIWFTNLMTRIVISIKGAAKNIEQGNKYVFSLTKEYPDRISQFYWVKLSQSNVLEKLECHFEEYRFKGIKLHQCWESFKVDSEIFHKVADWASAKNLPIFIHLFSKRQATQLSKYIKAHPKTVFIIAHLFGLERYIGANITTDNVYFEISMPQLISMKRLLKAIEHFGANRIILGSDTPYGENNLKLNIERVRTLNIATEQKDLILGGNMERLLNS